MSIILSAGHHKKDPGAIGEGGVKEADLTMELRDLIAAQLDELGATYILDKDSETLSQYLARIKPGTGSVVCDLHFNSAVNLATGSEIIIPDNANAQTKKLALELLTELITTTGLHNRGVKSEALSHRGRLGILHTPAGISVLPEICFINNPKDLELYHKYKKVIAIKFAKVLAKHDNMYN